MALSADAKYPSRRAYVIKLRSDAAPGALCGRLENLLSCDQREFCSASELIDLIEVDLGAASLRPEAR